MITISRTGDMKADLIGVLKIKGVNAEVFDYYGIVTTSGEKFSAYTLQECQMIADKLAEDTVIVVPVSPGQWQPGAMRYLIYLIR